MGTHRINYSTTDRIHRRLKDVAKDKGQSMNDVIDQAVKDHLDRLDMSHSAPDLVLDRLGQILNILIAFNNHLVAIESRLTDLERGQ